MKDVKHTYKHVDKFDILKYFFAGNQITCPTCNIQCEASRLIENHFLIELANSDESSNASKVTDLKCSSCSDEAPASSYCADCSEFICDNCVQAHQRCVSSDHKSSN